MHLNLYCSPALSRTSFTFFNIYVSSLHLDDANPVNEAIRMEVTEQDDPEEHPIEEHIIMPVKCLTRVQMLTQKFENMKYSSHIIDDENFADNDDEDDDNGYVADDNGANENGYDDNTEEIEFDFNRIDITDKNGQYSDVMAYQNLESFANSPADNDFEQIYRSTFNQFHINGSTNSTKAIVDQQIPSFIAINDTSLSSSSSESFEINNIHKENSR